MEHYGQWSLGDNKVGAPAPGLGLVGGCPSTQARPQGSLPGTPQMGAQAFRSRGVAGVEEEGGGRRLGVGGLRNGMECWPLSCHCRWVTELP